jgi:dihydroflavonol-4-reductase
VTRKLRERGDEVVALVRSPERASALRELGCELVEGDLSSEEAVGRGAEGCESVFHVGAVYEVGIPSSEHAAMFDANVSGTERVLDAAVEAGARRIVYVSTVNTFGNTRGQVVDESYRRPDRDWLSYYDETKYLAHEIAQDRIASGAPIVIAMPGGVYGPGDHSQIGHMIEQAATGKLRARMFPEAGVMLSHVEDVAEGILLVHDRGRIGESYVLAGEQATMGELVDRVCSIAGRRAPRLTMPAAVLKASAPLGGVLGPALGFPPNVRELIKVSDNVTYWARDDKARRELGYAPRDLDTGLRQTLGAR